jgi:hypothetical protein
MNGDKGLFYIADGGREWESKGNFDIQETEEN